jgi:3-oxoacyl-[acyl-carrier protein] reductase
VAVTGLRRYAGKGVIVTGGASGLGLAAVHRFADEGARVLAMDRDAEGLDRLRAERPDVAVHVGDVTVIADVEALIAAAARELPRIDVLISNAGIAHSEPFLDIPVKRWREILAVNLDGMFNVTQHVGRVMAADGGGGAMVLTSSTNGLVGERHYAHYNASKGGVTLLMKSLALDLAEHGIRANAVCPGYIETPMSRAIDPPEFVRDYVERHIPIGRTGNPEDVAGALAFLASDDAGFITGETLLVDGGQLAF